MSAFSETALIKKLNALNTSQQSIQTLSLWLIHHRKHHERIVKTWYREFEIASESKKLTLIYLANDVIQNSKKKGPEFNKEYGNILPQVFTYLGENQPSQNLIKVANRILNIWQERGVYDQATITDYRGRLFNEGVDDNSKIAAELIDADIDKSTDSSIKKPHEKIRRAEKRRHEKRKEEKYAHVASTSIRLSPVPVPVGDPPEPDELIRAIASMENAASGDVEVRERIANLPPEISDISCLNKAVDLEEVRELAKQINEAVELINDYNSRLAAEMDERTQLAIMLRDFLAEQKALLAQAEQRFEEYKKKLAHIQHVQKEIENHLNNLPDLTKLPDVTGLLAPLPSAGDLFNIH